jgi:hypothetical protein
MKRVKKLPVHMSRGAFFCKLLRFADKHAVFADFIEK